MMKRAWENTKKHKKHWKLIKTWSPIFARYGHPRTQKCPKTAPFPRRIVFYTFHGICRHFRPEVLHQTPKKAFLGPRSYSKDPNYALEKVLNSETLENDTLSRRWSKNNTAEGPQFGKTIWSFTDRRRLLLVPHAMTRHSWHRGCHHRA